jgi:hypothetical protein
MIYDLILDGLEKRRLFTTSDGDFRSILGLLQVNR